MSSQPKKDEERRDKEEERKRKEAERLAKEQAERQKKEAEVKRREAERKAREDEEKKRREDEERRKAEEKARIEAERRAKLEAEKQKKLDEERRVAEEKARREAERMAKEQAELKRRQDEEKRRMEEQAKKEAEKRAREEADRKHKAEEEARKSFLVLEKARKEAEKLAKVQAERKQKEEAERRAKELEEQRKREEEERRRADRLAKEEADRKRREEEEKLREQQRLSKEQAERQRKLDEERRRTEELSRREAERRARELEEQKRVTEEKARKESERLKKEQEERERAEEEARLKEQERLAREQAETKRRLDEEKRRSEELARREAERKRVEDEQATRKQEEARRQAEKLAKEVAEQKRLEEESRLREQQRLAREEAEKKRVLEEQKKKAEEQARMEAERRARELQIQQAKEAEEKRKAEERARKETEKLEKEQAERKQREEEQLRREQERIAKETAERKRKEEKGKGAPPAPPIRPQQAPGPTPAKPPTANEAKKREREVIAALTKVKIHYPATGTPVPPTWKTLERYPVNSPFAFVVVAESPLATRRYFLDEVPLTKIEAGIYSYLLGALEDELTVPRTEVNPRQYFADQARRILLKYSIRVPATSWSKILYYAERDLVGFGVIDGMMRDPNIEDISIDAVAKPIFIYHKGYENLESNVTMADDDDLDSLVTRLSHMAGKHVSTAFPIVQGTLPGRHRLVATFRREVSPLGSSATIRKFREDPLTIIDMLNLKLMDYRLAAYAWLLMQNRATGVVVGASVDHETPIIYRENGRVGIEAAGRLIDPFFQKGKDGRAYASGIEVFCFDPKTYETKWSPIQYVYRHRHFGEMLRFRLQTGREVTVTRDHSIFVLRNGRIQSVHAAEIGLGDFVVAPKGVQNELRENLKVDLTETFAEGDSGAFLYGVPRQVFDRVKGIPADVRKDWKHVGRLPVGYSHLLLQSEKKAVKLGYKGSKTRLDPLVEVDPALARLLGYYVAEGALKYKRNQEYTLYFTLGPKDKEMAEDIIRILRSKFGTPVHLRKHRGNSFRVVTHNRILVDLLRRWVGTGAGHKVAPQLMLNSPSAVRRAFLEAWSRGDGGVTTSKRLMNGVLYLLLMEESIGTSYFRKARGQTVIEGRKVNDHDSYYMRFPRPEELSSGIWRTKRTQREPGYPVTEVPDRLRKMGYKHTRIFGNYSRGQRVTERNLSVLRRRMKELSEYSGTAVKGMVESTHDGFYRSNSKLYDRVNGQLRANQTLLELDSQSTQLEHLSRSNLAFLKVVGLEEVDSTSEFVYDVSVPECENFLAGFGGVFCHNTGAGKTTLLNALLTLTRLNTKVVTIEEVQEVNIPHQNWTALVSRESYAATEEKAGAVDLFDLVKSAMRMRPDILVVGEVRGEEAYVLFQAISSVVAETPVLVREREDVKLIPIGDLVDRFYPGDSERVPVPVEGIDVLTSDKNNKVLFRPVNYVLRHKADEIYDVRYNGGEVKATGSHSVFVFDENCDLVAKPVSELKPGDMLASFSGSQVQRDHPIIDVESILRQTAPDRVVTERAMPSCPFCKSSATWKRGQMEGSQRYTCKDCRKSFYGSREGLQFRNVLQQVGGTELISFSRSSAIPKSISVDEQFAKVLGTYMADGCVKHHRGSRVVFSLGTPEKQLFVNDLVQFFSRFGSSPSIDDRGTYSIIEFNHSPLAAVFESLCGRTLSEKHIPSFIWTSPPSIVAAFLEGWKADARRTLRKNYDSYVSARPDLVNALSWLARLNGRTTSISERNSKYRSANISRVGLEQKSKAISILPLLRLKKMLNSTAWYHGPDSRKKTISKMRARKALEEILRKKRSPLTWEAARLASKITSLLEGPLIAVPVRRVTKRRFDGFVYDLSVPDTEAFFGGESPVALHNTGHGGICTLHADDTASALQRLTSEPMNVPPSFLPFLDLSFVVRRISIPAPGGGFRSTRRIISVDEIEGEQNTQNIFRWDPRTDTYAAASFDKSIKIGKIARNTGVRPSDIISEIERRGVVLKWLQQRGIRNFKEVSPILEIYASKPQETYERALNELQTGGVVTPPAPGDTGR